MDKSCQSKDSGAGDDSTTTTTTNTSATTISKDDYLRHLNKISHKISKQPALFKKPPPPSLTPSYNQQFQQQQQLQQNQPPVYNINKSDFRDVVQKLTGSPVHHHDRFNTPTPIQPPKPASSRLHRIRPPPLAHLSKNPTDLLSCPVPLNTYTIQRSVTALSPLPAFPSVHLATESPVSAYLRSISTVDSDPSRFSGFSTVVQPLSFQFPAPSPRSGSVCSPTGGQLGFGSVSPKVPVDSPRWRDVV